MSLTLNIIEHDLAEVWEVVRAEEVGNPSFKGARLFLGTDCLAEESFIFICDNPADAAALKERGLYCIFVDGDGCGAKPSAALSVLGSSGMLQVFNHVLDVFSHYEAWEREMDRLTTQHGCLQRLMDVSEPYLRNNTVIVDPALKLLAHTRGIPCDDPITMELIGHGYHTEGNIRKFKLHKRFRPWSEQEGFILNDSYEICKYVTVVRSFKMKEGFSLIIVMMCNIEAPCGWLLDTYEMFAARVGIVAKREYPDDKPAGNAVDSFLKDLLGGGIGDERRIQERCRSVGIPFEARFCLFDIPLDPNTSPVERILADLSILVAPAKTLVLDGSAIVLCFNCLSDSCSLHCVAGSCPMGHRSLSARLSEYLGRNDLHCGRSSKFRCLASAPTAYRQALYACRLGLKRRTMLSRINAPHFEWERIVSFDHCCMDYVVEQCGEGLELAQKTYAGLVVDALASDDAHTGTDNYTFLYEYLVNERRASVVAEKLHMHRNNVKYRIDRIEELYGIDTDDPALRLDLLMAYLLREASLVQDAQ